MRIALDAMGGDRAPAAPVDGAMRALDAFADLDLVLVGDGARIQRELDRLGGSGALGRRLSIHEAPEVVDMNDDPVRAMRAKPKNSARVCAEILAARDVEGVVNMGSTGAAVAAAALFCQRLEGVRRPGIAAPFPRVGGATIVADAGANPDARAEHLHQYAVMASQYVRAALGVEAPRVGILSIGEEEHKGNRLVHETWEAFRRDPIPGFLGNVEPREFFEDRADVVVADGFSGNVALKAAEGMAEYLLRALRETLPPDDPATERTLRELAVRVDYAEYGGAPLLGIRGAYVIGHGRSDARAVASAIRAARAYVAAGLDARIVEQLAAAGSAAGAEGS